MPARALCGGAARGPVALTVARRRALEPRAPTYIAYYHLPNSAAEDVTRGASLVASPAELPVAPLSAELELPEDALDAFASLAVPDEVVSATAALAGETWDLLGRAMHPWWP